MDSTYSHGSQWIQVEFTKDMWIEWDFDDLLQDATTAEESRKLAMAGLVLSNDAELAAYKAENVLRNLGFEDIRSEYYLLSTETKNEISNPARTFGHKLIEKDGKQYHVICTVVKGTTTLPDTITDIKSVVDGFYEAGKNCADSLKQYISGFEGITKENTILFITGHSLGASTANVIGRLCGDIAYDEHKFVYTFASPNYETEGEADSGETFPCFRTFTNYDDVVPYVPPRLPPTFFSKIGIEHMFHLSELDEAQKERFQRVYTYFREMRFEDDKSLLGLGLRENESLGYRALKNHMGHTYMAFILSELPDSEIDHYIR